jgi:hypothetical protein
MSTIIATPATLAALGAARAAAENELRTMRRINSAFKAGRREFLRRGFADADYRKFADTIARHPEYGPVPFPPRLVLAKVARIERLDKQIAVGKRFLTPAQAS